ncbi:hypothetical protein ABKV19_008866, partial [Rosa sericea]
FVQNSCNIILDDDTGITPLYDSSLVYAGPASLVWGWVVVSFFTWFVGLAMAEICSSFPNEADNGVKKLEFSRNPAEGAVIICFTSEERIDILEINHPESPFGTKTRVI